MTLRELGAADAPQYQQLRLSCVQSDPHSFCTSPREVARQSLADFQQLIEAYAASSKHYLLGVVDPDHGVVGSIALERLAGEYRAHKARLWGLMVMSAYRRRGLARQLCEAAMTRAKEMEGVEKLVLELTGEALPALHLYRGLGFRIESVEPLALKQGGRYLDEIRMAQCL